MSFAIEVKNLRKTFDRGKVVAVNNISFKVKKGEFFGFLGVNGAGKTTTINMLTGILNPDSGEIRILGRDPKKEWEYVKNRINMSTAYYSLSSTLTVMQNLKVYAKLYNVKYDKINDLLKKFELTKFANKKIRSLSSGEKTRVALCKGLINNPQVLFLDECTIGLDPDIAEKTRRIINDYQKESNATVFFTSHYMYEVEELCNRIAFMKEGKIVKISTADDLKKAIKKQTVYITLKRDLPNLKKLLEDEDVDILFTKDNTIVFEVSWTKDRVYKVLNKIFKQGFKLSDLHIKKPTLDDIFIHFARK